jgi:hypothetical protein
VMVKCQGCCCLLQVWLICMTVKNEPIWLHSFTFVSDGRH